MKGVYSEEGGRERGREAKGTDYEARQIRKAERRSPSDLQRQRERERVRVRERERERKSRMPVDKNTKGKEQENKRASSGEEREREREKGLSGEKRKRNQRFGCGRGGKSGGSLMKAVVMGRGSMSIGVVVVAVYRNTEDSIGVYYSAGMLYVVCC